jgi:hypothetical protein
LLKRELTIIQMLLYNLADDTVQVLESLPSNSGRDHWPVFAKRQTPPKDFPSLESKLHSQLRYNFHIHSYFLLTAFRIGQVVNIFNRKFTM